MVSKFGTSKIKILFLIKEKWLDLTRQIENMQNDYEITVCVDLKSDCCHKNFYDFFIVDNSIFLDDSLFDIHNEALKKNNFLIVNEENLELESKRLDDKFLGYIDLGANIFSNLSYLKNICENIRIKNKMKFDEKVKDKISLLEHKFIDTLHTGVLFQDKDGYILGMNPAAEVMLGITKIQGTGTLSIDPRWGVINEDGSKTKVEDYPSMIAIKTKEKVVDRVIGIHNKNEDKVRWIKVNAVPSFKNGEIDIVYSHFEDITEVKYKDEYMKLLASAIEYSPISILITDAKGIIQSANPKFEEITGYKKEDLVGKNPRILKHKSSTTNYKELWDTIHSGAIWHGEFVNVKPNGEKYSEEAVIAPVRNKFNKITHFIALKEDITDLKRVKRKLENTLKNLETLVDIRTDSLRRAQKLTLESLAILAEYRDNETGEHIQRTKHYMKLILDKLKGKINYNDNEIEQMWTSAPLHDIGKVAISDSILLKPGKLTKDEYDIMKKHVIYGNQALLKSEDEKGNDNHLKFAKEITLYHHEKWDGTGYPEGLSGKNIPLSARVMALADVYDALRSKRPYKEPYTHEKVVNIILEEAGKHFDPMIIKIFLDINLKFDEVFNMYSEESI